MNLGNRMIEYIIIVKVQENSTIEIIFNVLIYSKCMQ